MSLGNFFTPLLIDAAVSAYQTSNIITHLPTAVKPPIQSVTKGYYSILIGLNDYWLSGSSAATIYANIQTICSTVSGYSSSPSVIVFTELPAAVSGWETVRQSLNTLIRNGGSCPYTVADVGNDATIGQAGENTNLTYYNSDQIHPNNAGSLIIGTYLTAALKSISVQ